MTAFQYLEQSYKKDRDKPFSKACCSDTGDGFILEEGDSD